MLQTWQLCFKLLQALILLLAITCASAVHTLLYAALGDKLLLQFLQERHHHPVDEVAERDGIVTHLLVSPLREERLIIGQAIMIATIVEHISVARFTANEEL